MSEKKETGSGGQGFKGSGSETRTPEPPNPVTPSVQTSGNDREIRLAKLAKLREAGVNPYAYKWDRTHTNAKAVAEFEVLEQSAKTGDSPRFRCECRGEADVAAGARQDPVWSHPG
jgi:hypothetical protein